jgi:hypothetical protein
MDAAILAADAARMVTEFGEPVTYHPDGGADSTITAIFELNSILPAYYQDGQQHVLLGVLTATAVDVPTPSLLDTFTVRAETWAVKAIQQETAITELQLERREQERVGGQHSYIQR